MWSALGFLLLVLAAGTAGVAATTLGAWRRLRSASTLGGAALDELAGSLARLELRLAAAGQSGGALGAAVARLSSSVRRAQVLFAAAEEVHESIGRVRTLGVRK